MPSILMNVPMQYKTKEIGAKLISLEVDANGEYWPVLPVNGFKKVTVSVPPTPIDGPPYPTIVSYPKSTQLQTPGQLLSESLLYGGSAKFAGLFIPGTFEWVAPNTVVNATGMYQCAFIPEDQQSLNITIFNVQVFIGSSQVLTVTRQRGISDPAWNKIGYNATLTATANKLSSIPDPFVPAQDDYFKNPDVPVFGEIDICNVSDETGEIISWLGDPDFKWNGENNTSVYTYYPAFWMRRRDNGGVEEISVATTPLVDGVEIKAFLMATFSMRWETINLPDGIQTKDVLRSYADIRPNIYINYNIGGNKSNLIRTRARETAGNNSSGGDWRAFVIGLLHIVKYGTNHIQNTIGQGRNNIGVQNLAGLTGLGSAHLTLLGRDGYIGSQTSTSIWSLGICDFWSNTGIFMDGVFFPSNALTDNVVLFCSIPSKFVDVPTEETDGYTKLGYEIYFNTFSEYTTKVGLDETNDNPAAQFIPLRVLNDTNATSSTGTTDCQVSNGVYSPTGMNGYASYACSSRASANGIFGFNIGYYSSGSRNCGARVIRPINIEI